MNCDAKDCPNPARADSNLCQEHILATTRQYLCRPRRHRKPHPFVDDMNRMHINGASYREIGATFGVTGQWVSKMLVKYREYNSI